MRVVRHGFLFLVRWGIPAALTGVGFYIVYGTDIEGVGEALVCAAFCVLIANWLFRFSLNDYKDRDKEEAARAFFDEHGHWPGESPPNRPPR